MKKLTLIIGLIIFTSCSLSKEKQLISDYEQTIGNTKTDLNLKFEKVEFVKDITSKDSSDFLTKFVNEEKEKEIKNLTELIDIDEETIQIFRESGLSEEMINVIAKETFQQIENNKSILQLYNEDCRRTPLEPILIKINKLETNLDSVLCKEYDVTYTIENPFLNNAKQTLSKIYYINSDITKILKVESKESI